MYEVKQKLQAYILQMGISYTLVSSCMQWELVECTGCGLDCELE